jgi:hypothetical protein
MKILSNLEQNLLFLLLLRECCTLGKVNWDGGKPKRVIYGHQRKTQI